MNTASKKSWRPVIVAGIIAGAVIAIAVWQATGPGGFSGPRSITDLNEVELAELDTQRREAYTHLQTGKLHIARPAFERLVKSYPDDPQSHMLLGRTLFGLEDIDGAIRHFNRTIELDPEKHEAHYMVATISLKRGDAKLARAHLVKASQIKDDDPRYALLLGQAQMDLGEMDAATVQLLRALRLNSGLPEAHGRLAEIAARERKWPIAVEQVDKAIALLEYKPQRALTYRLLKAQYLRRANRTNEALNVLLALDPEVQLREPAVEQIARCYMKLGDPTRAAFRWADLFRGNPQNARAAAEAGLAFHQAGSTNEAREYLDRARRVDPRHERVQLLAAALEK